MNKLSLLDLSCNYIKNISFLENLEMKNIKKLVLNNNKIENIDILGKKYINLRKITHLDLSYNVISNIKVIQRMFLENLKSLNLNNNKIKSINPLENIYCPNLTQLDISHNLIDGNLQKNFDVLENFSNDICSECSIYCDLSFNREFSSDSDF